ncbi:MAG TPA: HRDC domain-containing protein [Polyangiaceae bacterium]|nr:HRDC domain-containing protein [Polyangiaceae bacterium]
MSDAAGAPVPLLASGDEVARLAARLAAAPLVALDAESNGLYAYRPSLCTLQIAWQGPRGEAGVAVIDTLRAPVEPLAEALGPAGPPVVVHDLTLDVRLLRARGVTLGNVRDTSVAARLLGRPGLGLAALVASELGGHVDKALQNHDWARRPLLAEHLAYLAGDVTCLLPLWHELAGQVAVAGIGAEVVEETAYKLAEALSPRPGPPAYQRVRGFDRLDAAGRAVLRRAHLEREAIAEALGVPPFRVAPNEWLVALARARPATEAEVRALEAARAQPAVLRQAEAWARAVRRGLEDGDPLPDASAPGKRAEDRAFLERRRAREARLRAWRRRRARERGVDEQAVLPGHCLSDVAALREATREALAAVPGLGRGRLERDGDELLALVREGDADAELSARGRC